MSCSKCDSFFDVDDIDEHLVHRLYEEDVEIIQNINWKTSEKPKEVTKKTKHSEVIENNDPALNHTENDVVMQEASPPHVRIVHNKMKDKDLSCSMCDKCFKSKHSLNYHFDVSHASSSAEVRCKICDKKLGHSVSLERHMKLHKESPKLHQCKHCLKQFTRKETLTVHKRVVHKIVNRETDMVILSGQDKESFACRVCGLSFSGEEADKELVAHLVNKCRPEERFPCNKCDKDFSSKFNMKQHERGIHFNVTKNVFCCKFCDFLSKHKTSITRHEKRKHGKE